MKTRNLTKRAMLPGICGIAAAMALAAQGNELNGTYAVQQPVDASQINSTTTTAAASAASAPTLMAASPVTLPSGTTMLVRMMDTISSQNDAGASFTTKLEYNLVVNGVVAVPAGTAIYGKVQSSTQARRATGKSTLDIRLVQMVIGGSPVPITSSGFQQAGEASIKKAARGAAAGAAVGAIGGDAGKGAAIGASASVLKKGQTITIPPNTLLEFTLTQPVTVNAGP
jgi:Glycine-zipper domain